MRKNLAKENARLRRLVRQLTAPGLRRDTAMFNYMHIQGQSVASAATITLLDPACHVTGTVTITAIAQAPRGQRRTTIFDDVLILTHSASLFLPNDGANITTAANDIADWYSMGDGNWICEKYTLANGAVLGVVPIDHGGTSATTEVDALDNLHIESVDIASATVVDLSVSTGNYVTITGTTTIEGFSQLPAGAFRVLTFADSLTLKHSASQLKLPTGADIITQAGDRLTIRSLG